MRYRALYILSVLCLWPMSSAAVTRDTFLVRTTQELVDLCTVPEDDPLHAASIGFCFGYLVGAYQYQVAAQSGPDVTPLFCMTDPAPTRRQAVEMFITWARANPQYHGEKPVDTIMRFLSTRWPCPAARSTSGAASTAPAAAN